MEPYSNSAPASPSAVLYVSLADGRRLPVVDVAHPAFAVHISEADLEAQADAFERESSPVGELPPNIRAALAQSMLGAAVIAASGTYLAGLPTYVFKLGPEHLGSCDSALDRRLAASFPALTMRIRIKGLARSSSIRAYCSSGSPHHCLACGLSSQRRSIGRSSAETGRSV